MFLNFMLYGVSSQQEYDYHHYFSDSHDELIDDELKDRCKAVWFKYHWGALGVALAMVAVAYLGLKLLTRHQLTGIALVITGIVVTIWAAIRSITADLQLTMWSKGIDEKVDGESIGEFYTTRAKLIQSCKNYQGPKIDPSKKEDYIEAYFKEHPLNGYFEASAPGKLKPYYDVFHSLQGYFNRSFKNGFANDLRRQGDWEKLARENLEDVYQHHKVRIDLVQTKVSTIQGIETKKAAVFGTPIENPISDHAMKIVLEHIKKNIDTDYERMKKEIEEWIKREKGKLEEAKQDYFTQPSIT